MKKLIMFLSMMLFIAVSSIVTSTPASAHQGQPHPIYISTDNPILLADAAMASEDVSTSMYSYAATPPNNDEEPPLPAEGAGIWEWLLWLIGIMGFSTIVRVFFRFVPSAINVDWVGYIIQFIDLLLGKWIPNRAKTGKNFK